LQDGATHTISGTIARGDTAETPANGITFGGTVNLGGNVTLAGIIPNFSSGVIMATADLTINGSGAGTVTNTGAQLSGNGYWPEIKNVNNTSAAPIQCWYVDDGGGNTNVFCYEPKGSRMLDGVGP